MVPTGMGPTDWTRKVCAGFCTRYSVPGGVPIVGNTEGVTLPHDAEIILDACTVQNL